MRLTLLACVLWLAACAPLQPTQTGPQAPVTEREYFTRGAQYGCSTIVLGLGKIVQVDITNRELGLGVLQVCRTFGERVTRLIWDNGIPAQEGEPPIVMPSQDDPL